MIRLAFAPHRGPPRPAGRAGSDAVQDGRDPTSVGRGVPVSTRLPVVPIGVPAPLALQRLDWTTVLSGSQPVAAGGNRPRIRRSTGRTEPRGDLPSLATLNRANGLVIAVPEHPAQTGRQANEGESAHNGQRDPIRRIEDHQEGRREKYDCSGDRHQAATDQGGADSPPPVAHLDPRRVITGDTHATRDEIAQDRPRDHRDRPEYAPQDDEVHLFAPSDTGSPAPMPVLRPFARPV